MKKCRRIIFLAICLGILCGNMILLANAATTVADGTCGNNLTWVLDDEGTLTISGSGKMALFRSPSSLPWYDYLAEITTVKIEQGVTDIGQFAFMNCDSLTSVSIPDSVTIINRQAFSGCNSLHDVSIPSSVTSIGMRAFSNCSSLTSVSIPDSVTSIGAYAFYYCTGLTNVTIPDSVTSIGSYAFYYCHNLADVIIPSKVTNVGSYAFAYCYDLENVAISNGVTSIDSYAFYNCSHLANVAIPASVTNIGSFALNRCGSLEGIWVDADNLSYCSDEYGVLFNKEKTILIQAPELQDVSYKIPETVETIENGAFYLAGVKGLEVPASVTAVGTDAISANYFMDRLVFQGNPPSGVENIKLEADSYNSMYVFYPLNNKNWTAEVRDSITEKPIWIPFAGTNNGSCGDSLTWHMDTNTGILTISGTGVMDDWDGTTTFAPWTYYFVDISSIVVEEGVDRIGSCAFYKSAAATVIFKGDAPAIGTDAFYQVTANVYYPNGNQSWTSSIKANYGGELSWIEEASITEQLRQIADAHEGMTAEEIRVAVQALDFDELLSAMRSDETARRYIAQLGKATGDYTRQTVMFTNAVPLYDSAFHSASGLTLNNVQNNNPIRLDKPAAAVEVPDGYDGSQAIHFSVNMDPLGNSRTMTVPICLSLHMSDEINATFQHVFWRNPVTNSIEEIPVVASWAKNGWYLEFVISAEGDYVIAQPENAVMSGKCGDNLTWSYDEAGTLTISGSGEMYDYDLGTNKAPWHDVRENVYHIVIGENVTGIGAYAFYDCRFADTISIPESVKRVGGYAFGEICNHKFIFQGDAPEIALTAFYSSNSTKIYYYADKQGWQDVISQEFVDGEDLEWIPIESESSVYCGENLTWEFYEDTGVLVISGTGDMYNTWWGYETINDLPVFAPWHAHAADITSVVINSGVTSIGHHAFFDCVNLTSVSIPKGVTYIGCAFTGCDRLEEVFIPASVTDFRYPSNDAGLCTGLKKITVAEGNAVYSSDEAGMLYNKDKTKFIGCPTGYEGTYAMADSVTEIGDWAFTSCAGLTGLELSDNLKTIGMSAFWECSGLTELILPESLTTISAFAFGECSGLSKITIPGNVTELKDSCFGGCKALKEVYFAGDAPDITYDSFYYLNLKAYYPADNETWTAEKLKNYGGTIEWVPYGADNFCGENLTWKFDAATGTLTISGTGAMYDYETNLDTDTNVFSSDNPWFAYRGQITSVVIESGVTYIGNEAFAQHKAVTSVTIPNSVTAIGEMAFSNCDSMLTLEIPESVTSIGKLAFAGSGLTSIVIPDTVTAIGAGILTECDELVSAALPADMEKILYHMFAGCDSLKTVTIPEGVTEIQYDAFSHCASLEEVTFVGNAPAIHETAFTDVDIIAYYPAGNETWTTDKMQQYGGQIQWIAYGETEEEIQIQVTIPGVDKSGAVVTAPEGGWKEGTNTFTVSCEKPCVVAVSYDGGETYVRLTATAVEGGYSFTAENMTADTIVAVAVMGDTNGDGNITNADVTKLRAAVMGKVDLDGLTQLAVNVNGDAVITNADVTKLRTVFFGKTTLSW